MKRVTIFGGSGFIGKSLVAKLARTGAQIVIAVRDVETANALRVCGDPGQIVAAGVNVQDPASIRRVVQGSDAVVNLLGILYESGKQTFERVHYKATVNIVDVVADMPDMRYIHMSSLGASTTSPSDYARSKGMAEEVVRTLLPDAMILRPSVVFGPGDGFFNRFGAMSGISPFLPLIGGGQSRFQPVYVEDVTDAIMAGLGDEVHSGFYELGGPDIFTFKELMEITLHYVGRKRLLLPIPFFAATIQAAFLQILPSPPLTVDQVKLLRRDNVISNDSGTLASLGITPHSVHAILPSYMDMHRKGGRFY